MTPRQYPAWWRRRHRGAPERRTMEVLATAMSEGDESAVRELLGPDVVLVIDSGGRLPDASVPAHGNAPAARLVALMAPGTSAVMASINGVPGFVLSRADVVVAAITAEARAQQLTTVWVVCNPDKLRHWNGG